MTDDPSSTTRRALLRHAVVGSTSVIGVQQISGDSRATGTTSEQNTDVTNGLTTDALISTVKSSATYELYEEYFEERENLVFRTENPAVYEIKTQSKPTTYGITFDLVDRSPTVLGVVDTGINASGTSDTDTKTDNRRVSADVTFRVEGSTVQESTALILERLDRNTTTGTKFWIVDGELEQESLTMTRSGKTIKAVQSQRVSTQSLLGIGCGDCKDLMRSICQVGCAAPSSLICTVSTGGIGGIACGVAADLICSHTPIPDNCTSDTTHKHWQLCKDAGFC